MMIVLFQINYYNIRNIITTITLTYIKFCVYGRNGGRRKKNEVDEQEKNYKVKRNKTKNKKMYTCNHKY